MGFKDQQRLHAVAAPLPCFKKLSRRANKGGRGQDPEKQYRLLSDKFQIIRFGSLKSYWEEGVAGCQERV